MEMIALGSSNFEPQIAESFPNGKIVNKKIVPSRQTFSNQVSIGKWLCDWRFKIWCVESAKCYRLHREMDIILV